MAKRSRADGLEILLRLGAARRLEQLATEAAEIRAEFPGISPLNSGENGFRRRRWKMSAAARKAVGRRMKKYWAERRKAKGKAEAKAGAKA
jgi:hypothetical protein